MRAARVITDAMPVGIVAMPVGIVVLLGTIAAAPATTVGCATIIAAAPDTIVDALVFMLVMLEDIVAWRDIIADVRTTSFAPLDTESAVCTSTTVIIITSTITSRRRTNRMPIITTL